MALSFCKGPLEVSEGDNTELKAQVSAQEQKALQSLPSVDFYKTVWPVIVDSSLVKDLSLQISACAL